MNWRVIFYRSASVKCRIEKFVEDLPVRVLYTFAGRQTILLLTGFVKKSKAVPIQRLKKAKALRKDYFVRVKGGENG